MWTFGRTTERTRKPSTCFTPYVSRKSVQRPSAIATNGWARSRRKRRKRTPNQAARPSADDSWNHRKHHKTPRPTKRKLSQSTGRRKLLAKKSLGLKSDGSLRTRYADCWPWQKVLPRFAER